VFLFFLLFWKTTLESMLKKTLLKKEKKKFFSITTRVRSRLAYPENAPFSICILFSEIAQGMGKRSYTDIK
jgi:hypothetical protein